MSRWGGGSFAVCIDVAARPFDQARRLIFKGLGAPVRPLLRSRETRIAVLGAGGITLIWVLAVMAPLWLLAVAPLVWGVPHLVADVRYLVVRPGLHRQLRLVAFTAPPLALAALGAGVFAGVAACAGVILAAPASSNRSRLAWLALALVTAAAWFLGPARNLVFAHLHNVIAIGLWWLWRPRSRRLHYLPLALVAIGAALIFTGTLDEWAWSWGAFDHLPTKHLPLGSFVGELSPGVPAPWGARLVMSFAFLQSVHYLIWLRMIPDEAHPRETPRSYRQSLRTLRTELGSVCLGVAIALALGIALWGVFDLANARTGYLRLALFHGHLEIAALTWLWLRKGAL